MHRRFLTALPALALAASLAACGSDSGPDSPEDASTTAAATSAATTASSAASSTEATDSTDAGPSTPADPDSPTGEMTMPGFPDIPVVPGTAEAFTGSWRDADGGAVLTFADDGTLVGTDGCNNFRSTWTLTSGSGGEGSVITVEPFATTMMACNGAWSPWILSMHTLSHDGDHLSVTNEGGTVLGELISAVPA